MGNSNTPDPVVAIAVMARDITFVKDTTKAIADKLDKFIDKADTKFETYGKTITECSKRLDATETGIRGIFKRISEVSNDSRADLNTHERNCLSREAVLQQLSKPSRAPKDTPKETRKPEFISINGNAIVPKWLIWIAVSVGIGIAVFVFLYVKMAQNFGN